MEEINIKFHSLRSYKAINGQLHALADFYLVHKLRETQSCFGYVKERNTPICLSWDLNFSKLKADRNMKTRIVSDISAVQ